MLQAVVGCSFPFFILILVAVASIFCARVIASEFDGPVGSETNYDSSVLHNEYEYENHQVFLSSQKIHDATENYGDIESVHLFEAGRFAIKSNNLVANHYACPPISLESLRKRYGTGNFWGDWSNYETRQFYRQMLPRALQIDGALGLTLEERAKMAAQARHVLRIYSRERCCFPGRVLASIYDGVRHLKLFGYWSSDGMSWDEIERKYKREAQDVLGCEASDDEIGMYLYKRIVERACATNPEVDRVVNEKDGLEYRSLVSLLLKYLFADNEYGGKKFLETDVSDFLQTILKMEKLNFVQISQRKDLKTQLKYITRMFREEIVSGDDIEFQDYDFFYGNKGSSLSKLTTLRNSLCMMRPANSFFSMSSKVCPKMRH